MIFMIAKILSLIGFFDEELPVQGNNSCTHTIKIYKKVDHEEEDRPKWLEYDTGKVFLPKDKKFKL